MTEPQWPDRPWVYRLELADIAGVNEKTIRREIQRGHITAERHGRQWVIDRTEAERWLTQYRKGNNPE